MVAYHGGKGFIRGDTLWNFRHYNSSIESHVWRWHGLWWQGHFAKSPGSGNYSHPSRIAGDQALWPSNK